MPEPPISIQPEPPHVRHVTSPRCPVPAQPGQVVSISALGSVNGKNDGRKRTSLIGTEQFAHHAGEDAFEMTEVDVGADHQPST